MFASHCSSNGGLRSMKSAVPPLVVCLPLVSIISINQLVILRRTRPLLHDFIFWFTTNTQSRLRQNLSDASQQVVHAECGASMDTTINKAQRQINPWNAREVQLTGLMRHMHVLQVGRRINVTRAARTKRAHPHTESNKLTSTSGACGRECVGGGLMCRKPQALGSQSTTSAWGGGSQQAHAVRPTP
jgi:hypothetical protein